MRKCAGRFVIGVFPLVDQFDFQGTEEALHRGIVTAVFLAAHRLYAVGGSLTSMASTKLDGGRNRASAHPCPLLGSGPSI